MWQFTIASMVIGAYLGREYPAVVLSILGVFLCLLAILILNPAAGAAFIIFILCSVAGFFLIPYLIGYGLGILFIYYFVVGIGEFLK